MILRFLDLLRNPDCFDRRNLPGHITASAWITDPHRRQVLLVRHRKLNRWLQPGGHADGDPDTRQVALREAFEETGLRPELISAEPWDIDIHTIPARPDFPEHEHFDVRYLFHADPSAELLISDESTDLKWFALGELPQIADSASILRMAHKTDPRIPYCLG